MMSPRTAPAVGRNAALLAHLQAGGTVLTPGRREARYLRRLHDAAQLQAGRAVWRSADVMPLAAWLADRWTDLADGDRTLPWLLDVGQAGWPWRRNAAAALSESLLAPHDLAGAARASWVALRRYGGRLDLLDRQGGTRDQRQFRAWAGLVESELAAQGWLDPGLLEIAVAGQAQRLPGGCHLLLAGFDRRPPALNALLAALVRGGYRVDITPVAAGPAAARVHAAADPRDELQALAGWLRARLLEVPASTLAAIVPELGSRRSELERILESALQPELEWPGTQERDRLFDLAGGPSLAEWGVADAALSCLETGGEQIETAVAGRLLLSRHVAAGDAQTERIRLDLRLRSVGLMRWPMVALAAVARESGCPGFARALEATATCCAGPGQRSLERWAHAFGDVLAVWRWPGAEALASDEFQAAQAVRDRLSGLAALGRTAPPLSLASARTEFDRLARQPFQPERGDPAVLVFDRLEPVVIGFDGLWVAGLGAATWPRAAAPDPFIPVRLQERLDMPGATPAACLAEAAATTDAWLACAPEVVFSWPVRQDDARLEPSRMLPSGLAALDPVGRPPQQVAALFDLHATEPLRDDPAPALDPAAARGGARIFELQSKCPFRAFAELRLGARPLEQPRAGVDARARGSALHRALELFWGEVGGRAGLDRDDAALESLLGRCVERALSEKLPAGLGRQARELERDWQRAALWHDVELERRRDDFQVVRREGSLRTELAGLPLRIVPDRVDRLADGSHALIDYKTGTPSTSHWQGPRPEQPQLPLYAVLFEEVVSAIAFAAVSADAARYAGVGRSADLLPGLMAAGRFKPDRDAPAGLSWEQLREGWNGTLTALARAHLAGEATVSPKSPSTCRNCHLPTLCRVAADAAAEEESGDG